MKLSQIPDGELFWTDVYLHSSPTGTPDKFKLVLFRRVTEMPDSVVLCQNMSSNLGLPSYFSPLSDVIPHSVESSDTMIFPVDE